MFLLKNNLLILKYKLSKINKVSPTYKQKDYSATSKFPDKSELEKQDHHIKELASQSTTARSQPRQPVPRKDRNFWPNVESNCNLSFEFFLCRQFPLFPTWPRIHQSLSVLTSLYYLRVQWKVSIYKIWLTVALALVVAFQFLMALVVSSSRIFSTALLSCFIKILICLFLFLVCYRFIPNQPSKFFLVSLRPSRGAIPPHHPF